MQWNKELHFQLAKPGDVIKNGGWNCVGDVCCSYVVGDDDETIVLHVSRAQGTNTRNVFDG